MQPYALLVVRGIFIHNFYTLQKQLYHKHFLKKHFLNNLERVVTLFLFEYRCKTKCHRAIFMLLFFCKAELCIFWLLTVAKGIFNNFLIWQGLDTYSTTRSLHHPVNNRFSSDCFEIGNAYIDPRQPVDPCNCVRGVSSSRKRTNKVRPVNILDSFCVAQQRSGKIPIKTLFLKNVLGKRSSLTFCETFLNWNETMSFGEATWIVFTMSAMLCPW